MSSSGLIYAVIVGAWAAYLVPMWLRRQDELNEARPTERFSTAIRLLSGRAAMERRYAKDLQARSAGQDEPHGDPDGFTGSVDVRALAVPTTRQEPRPAHLADDAPAGRSAKKPHPAGQDSERAAAVRAQDRSSRPVPAHRPSAARQLPGPSVSARYEPGQPAPQHRQAAADSAAAHRAAGQTGAGTSAAADSATTQQPPARPVPARREPVAEAAARAQRSKVLARRRRTTVMLFVAFTLGAVVAAVGGLAFLWAPGVPAVLLSAYIVYLRVQERRRFTYTMDRRRAEAAAQRLRGRQPRTRPGLPAPDASADEQGDTDGTPSPATGAGHSSLAADRRALVEQTDHAEWVDQQRERQQGPVSGDSWDPVPVPLPTYVTAPVAPRASGDLDLGAPGTWSSARSSAAEPPARSGADRAADTPDDEDPADGTPSDARRTASARPQGRKGRGGASATRERGRTPLFDQYADGDRPRAAGQ